MKTKTTIKQTFFALVLALSIVSCKKDKKDEPTTPTDVKTITITELKALSTGPSVKVPDSRKISGIVISDATAKNLDSKTIVLQQADSQTGIVVSLDAAATFATGDQVEVTVSNQTLAQLNGEIVLQNVPAANAKKTGTGSISPKATTIADITTNKTAWDGTLVTIAATELSGGNGKYTGSLTVKDASGTAISNVLAGAAFENTAYPISVSAITGIVRLNGNDVRIDIRKAADVTVGTVTRTITEAFDGLVDAVNGTAIANDAQTIVYLQINGAKTSANAAIGVWGGGNVNGYQAPWLEKDLPGNENITTAGKWYYHIIGGLGTSTALGLKPATPLQGLKTVTVTFAFSASTTLIEARMFDSDYYLTPWTAPDVYTFKPASDKIQIGIAPKFVDPANNNTLFTVSGNSASGTEDFVGLSPQYTDVTKEYTYTYTMPTETELATKASQSVIDQFIANPSFAIYNKCYVNGGNTNGAAYFSIIVKKVVLGFSN